LPDGLLSNQKSKFGQILEGLAMEDVAIFYGHLVHCVVFCYILWTFGIVHGDLVYFSRLGILYQEKSGNPDLQNVLSSAQRNLKHVTISLQSGPDELEKKSPKTWPNPFLFSKLIHNFFRRKQVAQFFFKKCPK
jgi:hypothetical protein